MRNHDSAAVMNVPRPKMPVATPVGDVRTGITIEGHVVHGDERGRTLGFPTANLPIEEGRIKDGVWAGTVTWTDLSGRVESHPAAISIGRRPTYYGGRGIRLLEAFLLDFTGNLYDKKIRVSLDERIRPQKRFTNSEALVQQLRDDVKQTRAWAVRVEKLTLPVRHGRFGPTNRRKPRAADYTQKLRENRRAKQEKRVCEAVAAADPGGVTHELIAGMTGIPLNHLLWVYPTPSDLRNAGSKPVATEESRLTSATEVHAKNTQGRSELHQLLSGG